jgi:hypothetical protein
MKILEKPAYVRTVLAGAATAAWLALPQAAAACATCYGASDSPMTAGMNNAILTLIGVVGEKATVRQRLRLIHGEKQ